MDILVRDSIVRLKNYQPSTANHQLTTNNYQLTTEKRPNLAGYSYNSVCLESLKKTPVTVLLKFCHSLQHKTYVLQRMISHSIKQLILINLIYYYLLRFRLAGLRVF